MANWSKKKIDAEVKSLSNRELLTQSYDSDYDGLDPRESYRTLVVINELENRLKNLVK